MELSETDLAKALEDKAEIDDKNDKLFYKRLARHYLADEARKDDRNALLTAAAYHKKTKILVTGFVYT